MKLKTIPNTQNNRIHVQIAQTHFTSVEMTVEEALQSVVADRREAMRNIFEEAKLQLGA